MTNKEAIYDVLPILSSGDFYNPIHQEIYEAIISLVHKEEVADVVTVAEWLRQKDKLQRIGGASFITSLVKGNISPANAVYYARIVRDKAMRRELQQKAQHIIQRSVAEEDVNLLLDEAEQSVFDVRDKHYNDTVQNVKEPLGDVMKVIEERSNHHITHTGLLTGYRDIDKLTLGLQQSEYTLLAARPSVGKTALALNMSTNMAIRHNYPVLFFSPEMSTQMLLFRLLSAETKLSGFDIKLGRLDENDFGSLTKTIVKLEGSPLFIDDTSSPTIYEIRAKARRLKHKENIQVVFIDYLQLIRGKSLSSRNREIETISHSLKAMAKELDIVVVALSQLSRQPEYRKNSAPILSDLRDSGALEQDADMVIFIHRPKMKDKDIDRDLAHINIAKQRNGPTGYIKLQFYRNYTRFDDYLEESVW